jgi:hypothetical protein
MKHKNPIKTNVYILSGAVQGAVVMLTVSLG